MLSNEELKKRLLDILEEDKEFRHAVAGAIGYKEILDRIARVEEEIRDLREENNRLRQDMQEGFKRHDEELKRHWESIEKLRQDMIEGFKRHDEMFKSIDKRLRYIESYIERTSITLEDEAREIIEYRLRERGLDMHITRLELPDIEIDIYGIDTDYCIIGEVKTRASPNIVKEVANDIAVLCERHPEYLRKKVIKVIYAMQVMPETVKEAERMGIWLMTGKGSLTELKVHE